MFFKSVLISALAASGAAARRTCGTPNLSDEEKLIQQNFQLAEAEARLAGNESSIAAAAATINVNIYYHVIAASSSGYLTQAQLNAQTAVLNDVCLVTSCWTMALTYLGICSPGHLILPGRCRLHHQLWMGSRQQRAGNETRAPEGHVR